MQLATQVGLGLALDNPVPDYRVAGNTEAGVEYILDKYRDACNSKKLGHLLYWAELEGLDVLLDDKWERFKDWYLTVATTAKNQDERRRDLTGVNGRRPDLRPDPDVQRRWDAQAKRRPGGRW